MDMELLQQDIDIFNKRMHESTVFFSRFEGKTQFRGATILDVGCGRGSMCIDMALAGANKVVGLDTDSRRIEFAKENLRLHYPELKDIVKFESVDLSNYTNVESFDYIVSKNTFEHIMD